MLSKVVTGTVTFTSLKPCDLTKCTKQDIKAYFLNSYDLNESLFTGLRDDSCFFKCPDGLRLPLIFYYGHTASVYVNKLVLAGLIKPWERIDLELETMLETGVDEMSWDDTENYRMGGKFKWPSVDRVIEYRKNVKQLILKIIDDTPLELPVTHDSLWWSLFMGMEHERIHLETSSVLIRQMPVSMVTAPVEWHNAPETSGKGAGENSLIAVSDSEITMGKPIDFPSYGWDNEYGNYKCKVPAFEASQYLIRNKDFLEFVEAGGYEDEEFWTEEGWKWRNYRQARHPTFWVCQQGCKSGCGGDLASYSHCQPDQRQSQYESPVQTTIQNHLTNGYNSYCNGHSKVDTNGHQGQDEGGGSYTYRYRAIFDETAMPWDWPVEVNYHEAKAYCTWRGPEFRLPLEAEHHVMRGNMKPVENATSCDIIYEDNPNYNINFCYGSSTPVNMFEASSTGFYDVFGNVWEWMEDHFNGLPGYDSHHYYDDFSSPSYDGRHNVILGGSWISTGDEASRFARYAFRRHFFQHCGFRVVRNIIKDCNTKITLPVCLISNKVLCKDNPILVDTKRYDFVGVTSTNWQFDFESEDALSKMITSEYGTSSPFADVIGTYAVNIVNKYGINPTSALHIGCGTGRASFMLAPVFKKVLAIDYAASFIKTCQMLQEMKDVSLLGKKGLQKSMLCNGRFSGDNITFMQLTWLPNEVGHHDFILVTSIDRVINPKAWLLRLREILRPGGAVVIVSTGIWGQASILRELRNVFGITDYEEFHFVDPEGHKQKAKVSVLRHYAKEKSHTRG